MNRRRTLDVSHLPTFAFGQRDPLWWGVMGLIVIESTVFVLGLASYFYIRGNHFEWPPSGSDPIIRVLATVNMGLLLLSCLPMHWANTSALKRKLRGMRWGLVLASLLGLAFLAIRIINMQAVGFRWDSHAYGSIFFTLVGLHTVHIIASTLENLVIAAVLFIGPVEEKHLVDVRVNGMYWFFVVASWVPFYVLLFMAPNLFRA
ncbi:cytochrome c oxidase subunit 3 [Hyalangium rubrum]|uniref:cytochrome-c oxidase n=1 Tax=Hyalangium rubrum TaxID=3103134 RepID=A0ABU5H2N7_9BACT|nr:cytochrome c oxidase subunit 3 [Hyalangium sp. s54d21]MDY7227704.1 cytochrome c oxidase subunit 3 [Hyalangium sp. s54d21]